MISSDLIKPLSTTKQPSILLVEDNRIHQTIASAILKDLDLKVDVAEDGLQALNLIKKGNYPVVLMDIQMPKMDGIEATVEIRKTHSSARLIIIALTANVTTQEVNNYLNIGMNEHLSKPYDKAKIVSISSKYLPIKSPQKKT